MKICEVSSDLQTDANDNLEVKRRRIPKRRLYSTSSDDNDSISDNIRPPRLLKDTNFKGFLMQDEG